MAQQYLIIGAGVAGVTAAEAIAESDPGGQITLIGEEGHDFYSRPGLAYYLTGELPERQLFLPQAETFQRITAKAIAVEAEARQVILEDGSRQSYNRLLIAVGSSAVMPAMPGADLNGVVNDGPVSPLARSVSPIPGPATEIGGAMDASSSSEQDIVAKSKEMLLELLGDDLKADEVSVAKVESREWSDASLGCPQPGMMYAQVLTSGYIIVLEAKGSQYEFHTNTNNQGVLCKIDGKNAWEVLEQ